MSCSATWRARFVPTKRSARGPVGPRRAHEGRRFVRDRAPARSGAPRLRRGRVLRHAGRAAAARARRGAGAALARRRRGAAARVAGAALRLGLAAPRSRRRALAPPDPQTEVPPPTLLDEPDPTAAAHAAAEGASSTTSLTEFPEMFPPVPLLSELQPASFSRVLSTVRVLRLPHGAAVIREGEPGNAFFFVACRPRARVRHRRARPRRPSSRGSARARCSARWRCVAAQPRSASVGCVGEADVLEVGRQRAARRRPTSCGQLAEALDRFTRERLLSNLMATSPLFRPFTAAAAGRSGAQVHRPRRVAGHRRHPRGRGGPRAVRRPVGRARGAQGRRAVRADRWRPCATGDVLRRDVAAPRQPATATVRAGRPATVLFLAREYFERLLAALPEMRAFFETLTEERLATIDNRERGPAHRGRRAGPYLRRILYRRRPRRLRMRIY